MTNACFTLFFITILTLGADAIKLKEKSQRLFGLWRYVTDMDRIGKVPRENVQLRNFKTGEMKILAYWNTSEECDANCKSDKEDDTRTFKCFKESGESDIKLKINNYHICWLQEDFPNHTEEFLFNHLDKSLPRFDNFNSCLYACRTVYGNDGSCNELEGNFSCYYKE